MLMKKHKSTLPSPKIKLLPLRKVHSSPTKLPAIIQPNTATNHNLTSSPKQVPRSQAANVSPMNTPRNGRFKPITAHISYFYPQRPVNGRPTQSQSRSNNNSKSPMTLDSKTKLPTAIKAPLIQKPDGNSKHSRSRSTSKHKVIIRRAPESNVKFEDSNQSVEFPAISKFPVSQSPRPTVKKCRPVFKENIKNTVKKVGVRVIKTSNLKNLINRRRVALDQEPTLRVRKVVFIVDHDLGYLRKRVERLELPSIEANVQYIYPKQGEDEVQSAENLREYDQVFMFLNCSPCLKQKTLEWSRSLSKELGLKMCMVFCYLRTSAYPTFDYEDDAISRKERSANEFYMVIKTPRSIMDGYDLTGADIEKLKEFIEKKSMGSST